MNPIEQLKLKAVGKVVSVNREAILKICLNFTKTLDDSFGKSDTDITDIVEAIIQVGLSTNEVSPEARESILKIIDEVVREKRMGTGNLDPEQLTDTIVKVLEPLLVGNFPGTKSM